MPFSWFRNRRRRRLLADPLSDDRCAALARNLWQYSRLAGRRRERLEAGVKILLAEKHWEGRRDFAVTEEMKTTIAGQAALMLLGIDDYYFEQTKTVIVYPKGYAARSKTHLGGWAVVEGVEERLGEAWAGGPVIVSWRHALAAGRGATSHNVTIHEFAHKLDMLDGHADGAPPLPAGAGADWSERMNEEFDRLAYDYDRGRRGVVADIAADDPAEFFAGASEAFFQRPGPLSTRRPQLYRLLADFYGQDPAVEWSLRKGAGD